MKKIFLLTFFLAFIGSIIAQDRTVPFTFTQDNQYLSYSGNASLDRVSSTKDSLALEFTFNKTYPVQYDFLLKLDSTSLPRVVTQLQGKLFENDTWSNIGSSIIYIGSADTTIKISAHLEPRSTLLMDTTARTTRAERYLYTGTLTQTAVSIYYRKVRILMVRTRGTSIMTLLEAKIWERQY